MLKNLLFSGATLMIFLWFGSTGKRNLNNKLKYSLDINFLDVDVIRSGNKLLTDLYIKPTDTHQYLEISSCHVDYSKRPIPYSQAFRLNRICSENRFFDNRCNQLECWLKDRGYNENVVRQQSLIASEFSRRDLLNQDCKIKGINKLIFNFIYHPAYSKIKHISSNVNFLLTPDAQYGQVFLEVPIVGKSLKDLLVRTKVPVEKKQMRNLVVFSENAAKFAFF